MLDTIISTVLPNVMDYKEYGIIVIIGGIILKYHTVIRDLLKLKILSWLSKIDIGKTIEGVGRLHRKATRMWEDKKITKKEMNDFIDSIVDEYEKVVRKKVKKNLLIKLILKSIVKSLINRLPNALWTEKKV